MLFIGTGMYMYLGTISGELDAQGHRSQVKVTGSKKRDFWQFNMGV